MSSQQQCLPCAEANMKALPFGIRDYTQGKSILDIIHTDLAGPMNVTALGGFKYIITFTDDFSRFITVYLLKNKNEATQAYKKFFNLVTNLHDKKIKRIHSDLGGEYMDTEWKQHNESNGVLCSQAPRKTPQLNGVAEVANRILFNKARAMMADSNLPKELWGEAVLTAALLKNLSPTKVKSSTPYFFWFNKKPELSFLRVWGSLAFMLDKKSKMDNKSTRGVLVGYNNTLTAYRILDLKTHVIKESRHVHFDESNYPYLSGTERNQLSFDSSETTRDEEFLPTIPQSRKSEIPTPPASQYFDSLPEQTTSAPVSTINTQEESSNEHATTTTLPAINPTEKHMEPEAQITPTVNPQQCRLLPTSLQDTKPSVGRMFLNIQEGTIDLARSQRTRKPNPKYANISVIADHHEPQNFKEATSSPLKQQWITSMENEISTLNKNNTWILVEKPPNANVVGSKWTYRIKRDNLNKIVNLKSRLVAVGCDQSALNNMG